MDALSSNSIHTLREHFKTGNVILDLVVVALLGAVMSMITCAVPFAVRHTKQWLRGRVRQRINQYRFCDTIRVNVIWVRGTHGTQSLRVNEANSILINGLLYDLMQHGAIMTADDADIVNELPTGKALDSRERNLLSRIKCFPNGAVEWGGMRFEFENRDTTNTDDKEPSMTHSETVRIYCNDRAALIRYLDACRRTEIERAFTDTSNDQQLYYWYIGQSSARDEYVTFNRHPWHSSKTFDSIFFPRKAEILRTLDHFRDGTGPWAPEKQRARMFNVFLWGKPGGGKTSFIKAMANYLNRHLFSINAMRIATDDDMLAVVSNESVNYFTGHGDDEMRRIPLNRRIYIFEDLDCSECAKFISPRADVPEPEELVEPRGKSLRKKDTPRTNQLSLSGFLNMLNGINELTGAMFVISTNHREQFDPAIYRPGRMDIDLELQEMRSDDIAAYMCRYYDVPELDAATRNCVDAAHGRYMPSRIEQFCQFSATPDEAARAMA